MTLAKKRLLIAAALIIGLALACAASFMFGARAISWQVVSAWIDDQPVKAIDAAVLEATWPAPQWLWWLAQDWLAPAPPCRPSPATRWLTRG